VEQKELQLLNVVGDRTHQIALPRSIEESEVQPLQPGEEPHAQAGSNVVGQGLRVELAKEARHSAQQQHATQPQHGCVEQLRIALLIDNLTHDPGQPQWQRKLSQHQHKAASQHAAKIAPLAKNQFTNAL